MPIITIQSGVTWKAITMANTTVMEIPIAKMSRAARNCPMSMPVRLTGAVRRAWSVFCLLSSLISRMVRMGRTRSMTMEKRLEYTVVRSMLFRAILAT